MYPDSYLEPIYLPQKLSGLYDFSKQPFSHKKVLWSIYTAAALIIGVAFFCIDSLIVIPSLLGNTDALMEHMGVAIVTQLITLKVLVTLICRKKLARLIGALEDPKFRYEDLGKYRPGKLACSSSSRLAFWVKATMAAYLGTDFTRHGQSLLGYFTGGIGHSNITCDDYLAFYYHSPFPKDTSLGCVLDLVFQMIVSFFSCQQLVGVESTFIGIGMYIRIHFINLEGAIRTCRLRCLRRLNISEDSTIFRDEDNPRLEKELNEEWRKISEHLQMLFFAVDELEQLLNIPVLVMVMTITGIITTCLYSIKTLPLDHPFLYMQVEFAITMLVLLTPYCYLGEELKSKCFDLRYTIFHTSWLSNTKSAKTSMMLHLTRLQKPAILSVGKFTPLSLNTLIQVLKGSYTYYTLLSAIGI